MITNVANRFKDPTRMAVWHAGNTVSNIMSGFLAAGILEGLGDAAGLRGWQWFFLIEGAASIIVGIAAYFILPVRRAVRHCQM